MTARLKTVYTTQFKAAGPAFEPTTHDTLEDGVNAIKEALGWKTVIVAEPVQIAPEYLAWPVFENLRIQEAQGNHPMNPRVIQSNVSEDEDADDTSKRVDASKHDEPAPDDVAHRQAILDALAQEQAAAEQADLDSRVQELTGGDHD